MAKAEIARLRRLELENAELRRQVDKHIEVYREQSLELIELRATLQLLRELVGGCPALPGTSKYSLQVSEPPEVSEAGRR